MVVASDDVARGVFAITRSDRPDPRPPSRSTPRRAPATPDPRRHVPVEHADDVVEMVGAPHRLVAGGGGEPDRAIVAAVARILAPSVGFSQRANGKRGARTLAIGPHDERENAMPAGGRGAVPFTLHVRDAAPSERALQRQGTAAGEPAMRFTRR